MMRSFLILMAASMIMGVSSTAHAQAQDPIPGVRHMHEIPSAGEKPNPKLDYKIVFDMKMVADSSGDVAPDLEFLADLINTFHAYGVPVDHMHLAAVFHGPTIVQLVDDQTYKERTGTSLNPNKALLGKLQAAGVKLMVCGQSALAQNYDLGLLARTAEVNLSATVTFINLQTEGYVKIDD